MRWLSFRAGGRERFGIVSGEQVLDASNYFPSLKEAIAAGDLPRLVNKLGGARTFELNKIEFRPPIIAPDKILCVGLNYKAHREETGNTATDNPTIFVRFGNAQVGHLENMVTPKESNTLDFEGEIAMIIGKAGRRISRDKAIDHVVGFSCYNDGSVREYQRQTTQFTPGKNFVGTGGFGPWMMTTEEIGNLDKMEVTTKLNNEVMQNAKASSLIFGFAELIEYCSTFTELVPGDVIVTGTPAGVGAARDPKVFLQAGDKIEVTVDPIGTLTNPVVEG